MENKNKAWLILPVLCLERTSGKYGITIGWLTYTITLNLN